LPQKPEDMKQQVLIARNKECEQLERCITSNRSEFVIVCGRRRIGKTFLIDSYFHGEYDFSFVGLHKAKTQLQLRRFAKTLAEYSGQSQSALKDWYDAFDALKDYLKQLPEDRKKVIFIDEMPWIDAQRSSFVSALEDFWNGWANRRPDILLIASGSATSWMANNLIANQGGLHNRITQRIYLEPFTLGETEEYLHSMDIHWSRYDILQCYMLTGGVPYYLSLLDNKLSVAQNIDALCFDEYGALRREYDELYNALFPHVDAYIHIVELLYQHKSGLIRKELAEAVNMNGSRLTTVLNNLEQCGFIARRQMYGSPHVMVYRLVDFYTLFYFKFIAHQLTLDKNWWSHHLDDGGIRAWRGLTFELICQQHHPQVKKALGINGMATAVSTWSCTRNEALSQPGTQVDMLIERADRVIHLCEIKFSEGVYNITAEYEQKLRQRLDVFRQRTKCKKTVVNTFITTFGVGDGKHRSIVHSEVTMDDLFG
jgi:hypothetical protein